MKISVCMATYNGEQFVEEQISSILCQLSDSDELIIIDDCSSDRTVEFISSICDERISLHVSPYNSGVIRSFEKILSLASGDIIFFSDQDDVWLPGKLSFAKSRHFSGADLFVHDAVLCDHNGIPFEPQRRLLPINGQSFNAFEMLMKNRVPGCCLSIRKEVLQSLLPLPKGILHDWYIVFTSLVLGYNVHISYKPLLHHRRHHSNASTTGSVSNFSLMKKLTLRLLLIYYTLVLISKRKCLHLR